MLTRTPPSRNYWIAERCFVWIALFVFGLLGSSASRAAAVGEAAPDFVLPELAAEDKQVELSSYRGKFVALNLWTLSCKPCLEHFPDWIAFQQEHPDVVVLAVHIGDKYSLPGAKLFMEEQKPPFRVPFSMGDELKTRYGVESFPTSILIDPTGKVAQRYGVWFDGILPIFGCYANERPEKECKAILQSYLGGD